MTTLSEQIGILVDGEMNEIEKTELLKHLDAEPDGWKRCALGFLEDQTLRAVLSEGKTRENPLGVFEKNYDPHEIKPSEQIVANAGANRAGENAFRLRGFFSFATCLLFGFFVGFTIHGPAVDSANPVDQVAQEAMPSSQPVSESFPFDAAFHQGVSFVPVSGSALVPQRRTLPAVWTNQPSENVSIPCFDYQSHNCDAIHKMYKDASRNVKERYNATGNRVNLQREFHVLRGDGNELILIPAQNVSIRYDGEDIFE